MIVFTDEKTSRILNSSHFEGEFDYHKTVKILCVSTESWIAGIKFREDYENPVKKNHTPPKSYISDQIICSFVKKLSIDFSVT